MTKENGEVSTHVTKKAPVVKKSEPKEKAEALSEKKIYVGPGKPGLLTNTVYDGDYPLYVQEMIDDCPEIEHLMVGIKDYRTAQQKTKEKGTLEYTRATKIMEYFKKEGNQ